MVISNPASFGTAAASLKASVDRLANEAHLAAVYVRDTANQPGQADYDLLQAAQCLEIAARDLRQLHARIQTMRATETQPA